MHKRKSCDLGPRSTYADVATWLADFSIVGIVAGGPFIPGEIA